MYISPGDGYRRLLDRERQFSSERAAFRGSSVVASCYTWSVCTHAYVVECPTEAFTVASSLLHRYTRHRLDHPLRPRLVLRTQRAQLSLIVLAQPLESIRNQRIRQRHLALRKRRDDGGNTRNGESTLWRDFIVLVGVNALCVETISAFADLLSGAHADPNKAVQAENHIDAGRSARRWEVVEMRFQPSYQSWRE